MSRALHGAGLALVAGLAAIFLASCSFNYSFCAGSGCGGSGKIDYGTSVKHASGGGYEVVNRKSTFHPGDTWAYVAHFSEQAGTHNLTITIQKGSKTVAREPQYVSHTDYDQLAGKHPISVFSHFGFGKYTMRFVRGSKKLAEGSFTIAR